MTKPAATTPRAATPAAADSLPEALRPLAPLDEHNRALQSSVHPSTWQNPEPQRRYNLVVIGAGTAGLVTAAGAAGLGAKVALIERGLMGGDCLNVGCVPSKALIRCARAAYDVHRAAEFGVRAAEPEADFPAIMERMRRLRAEMARHDSAGRFAGLGVDVFLGDASFVREGVVTVAGQELNYARAVIATGARAGVPRIPGLEAAGFLTNETVFSLTERPRRLAVIGGGPIGCELAQTFARLGSEVTIIQSADRILPRDDADAAEIVRNSLERNNVRILVNAHARAVEVVGDEQRITVELGKRDDASAPAAPPPTVTCDRILVAAGRTPNVQGLNLEAVGVQFSDREGVHVSDRLRTSNSRIYAAGDICSQYKFTHMADATARIVIQNALFFGRSRASSLVVPWATYTDPEVAHVGQTLADLEDSGTAFETIRIDLSRVDRAILDGDTHGFLKVHHRRGRDKILGATLVSEHAGEMIAHLSLAMARGLGLRALAKTIHPYPTVAEAIKKAGDAYNRTRLTPFVQRLFTRFLAWRR